MPLRAVVTPRFGDAEETRFVAVDPLRLARAASFTTMCQLPLRGPKTNEFVERLIERVPGFEIVLGRDFEGVVGALGDLLASSDRDLATKGAPRTTTSAREQPLISAIVPVYNGAPFLHDAVDAILDQRHPRIEIIVVDDGSTDDIEGVVASLPVEVRYFRQRNGGPRRRATVASGSRPVT